MSSTYFDAVLDGAMIPVFNGTAQETVAWLGKPENAWALGYQVCIGETLQLVSVEEYLKIQAKK